jgi:hypothetical protein
MFLRYSETVHWRRTRIFFPFEPAVPQAKVYRHLSAHLSTTNSADVLKFVTLPSLHTLKLSDIHELDEDALFLARSSPPLRKLAIHVDLRPFHVDIAAFRPLISGLTHLEVRQPSKMFLESFFYSLGRDPSFLLRLQHMLLVSCQSPPPAYALLELLAPLLTARWHAHLHGGAVARLRHFSLKWQTTGSKHWGYA